MAKSGAERTRECRQRKRIRRDGHKIEATITFTANDALLETARLTGMSRVEVLEWALLIAHDVVRKDIDEGYTPEDWREDYRTLHNDRARELLAKDLDEWWRM